MNLSKRFWILLAIILVLAISVFSFIRSNHEQSFESEILEEEMEPEVEYGDTSIFNNELYDKELEGSVVHEAKKSESDFFGTWVATSDRAEYLYGNINLTIHEDGTWTGNVTEEDFSGTWKYNGKSITLHSELVDYNLLYDESGVLLFQDHMDMEDYLVLTPGP